MVSKGGAAQRPPPPPRLRRPRLASISRASSRVSALRGVLGRRAGAALGRRSAPDARSRPRPISLRLRDGGNDSAGCLSGLCKGCLPSCCCCCCCCLNLEYLRTRPGALRVAQLAISWLCNWLLGRYALRVSGILGSAMPAFFLASAAGAMCCSLLLAVSVLSSRSLALLRASLLEIAFHITAAGLYGSQASYMHVATTVFLEPYKSDIDSSTYPAVVTSYWMGYVLAALHSIDIVYSLKHYRQYRA